jgi:hypothetical protein
MRFEGVVFLGTDECFSCALIFCYGDNCGQGETVVERVF